MQPLLQRMRGLVVQQPGKPALVAEVQHAGEKVAVRKFPLHFLGKFHQLIDPVGAEREARSRGQSIGVAVIDIERKRALQRGLELVARDAEPAGGVVQERLLLCLRIERAGRGERTARDRDPGRGRAGAGRRERRRDERPPRAPGRGGVGCDERDARIAAERTDAGVRDACRYDVDRLECGDGAVAPRAPASRTGTFR